MFEQLFCLVKQEIGKWAKEFSAANLMCITIKDTRTNTLICLICLC